MVAASELAGTVSVPERCAVRRRDAGGAASRQQHDLRDVLDRQQVRRAVARTGIGARPAWRTSLGVVCHQLARGGHDDERADDERRRGEAPVGDRDGRIGRHVARPHPSPIASVERVQDAGRAERVHATPCERWCRAGTGAPVRFPEADRVTVRPQRLAGGDPVARDDFLLGALLLSVEAVAANSER